MRRDNATQSNTQHRKNLSETASRKGVGMGRRTFLKAASVGGAVGIAGCIGGSGGGGFPSEGGEYEVWIPFGPGGGYDTVIRGAEQYLNKHFQEIYDMEVTVQPVNVSGGGGVRMANELNVEEPDGQVLGGLIAPHYIVNKVGGTEGVEYEVDAFEYVMNIEENIMSIVADPGLGFETWDDVVSFAESEGAVRVATGGAGATSHLVPLIMGEESGIEMDFIHFETIGEAPPSIERGEAELAAVLAGTAQPWVEDGTLQYLVLMNDEQSSIDAVPEIPLAPEQNIPSWEIAAAVGRGMKPLALAPETPQEILDVWQEVAMAAFSDQEFIDWAAEAARPVVQQDRETTIENVEAMHNSFLEIQDLLQQYMG